MAAISTRCFDCFCVASLLRVREWREPMGRWRKKKYRESELPSFFFPSFIEGEKRKRDTPRFPLVDIFSCFMDFQVLGKKNYVRSDCKEGGNTFKF